jgi:hypothetical protein
MARTGDEGLIIFWSVLMQRKAVQRQKQSMETQREAVERQKEGMAQVSESLNLNRRQVENHWLMSALKEVKAE